MTIRTLLPALLAGLSLLLAPAPAAEPDQATIRKLVEQLGSDTFAEREQASKALDAIGAPALQALREATKSRDAEVRKRAADLAGKLEKRLAAARVLSARAIHLVYKDTPLKEAVEDFRKKSGYPIVLHDPDGKLAGRTVTLDTGKVPFWTALERFCAAAGLTEGEPTGRPSIPPRGDGPPVPGVRIAPARRAVPVRPARRGGEAPGAVAEKPVPPQPAPPVPVPAQPRVQFNLVPGGGVVVQPVRDEPIAVLPGQITLLAGKPPRLPADTTSSIRVRAVDRTLRPFPVGEGEMGVLLEISPEPRLRWLHTMTVTIDRAVDDADQKLSYVEPPTDPNQAAVGRIIVRGGIGGPMWMGGNGMPWLQPSLSGVHHYAGIRLKKGDRASKTLKELSGTIAGTVLTDPEKLLVMTDVMKAAGKAVTRKEGGRIEVKAVEKQADGSVQITFEYEAPPDAVAETAGGTARVARQIRVQQANGAVVILNTSSGYTPYGLTLEDAKGNTIPATIRVNYRRNAGGVRIGGRMEYVATVTPPNGATAEPARLVYTGRRQTTVTVPFQLTGVELK